MPVLEEENRESHKKRRILWIEPLGLDDPLHKTDTLDILTSLAERGHSICTITMRSARTSNTDEHSRIRIIFIPIRSIPVASPIMFGTALFFLLPLYTILMKPEIIITRPHFSILSLTPTLFLGRLKKMKFILDIRSTPVETSGFRGFLQKFWFAPSVAIAKKLFDGITIITPQMKAEVCESFHISPNKMGVWTSGVSTALFNPTNCISEINKLRREFGLSRRFIVFYHGVFTATRGLPETIRAMKILQSTIPSVTFFLLGTGPAVSALKDLIQEEQLQDEVIIHHPVDHKDVPKYIGMSDVCILPLPNHPYWRSQCPLKLLEYLAMEKVVVTTDIQAHRLVIGESKCGIFAHSIEPLELARSINYAYDNKDRLCEWGKLGRAIVNEKYTWKKVAEDLENYLLSISKRVT